MLSTLCLSRRVCVLALDVASHHGEQLEPLLSRRWRLVIGTPRQMKQIEIRDRTQIKGTILTPHLLPTRDMYVDQQHITQVTHHTVQTRGSNPHNFRRSRSDACHHVVLYQRVPRGAGSLRKERVYNRLAKSKPPKPAWAGIRVFLGTATNRSQHLLRPLLSPPLLFLGHVASRFHSQAEVHIHDHCSRGPRRRQPQTINNTQPSELLQRFIICYAVEYRGRQRRQAVARV